MAPQIQYGKFVSLNIDDTKPIVQANTLRGLKTLYVRPQKNWPAPTGQANPTVPADVEIIIRNQIEACTVEDVIALPAVGLAVEIQGDGLEVFAHYSTKQGLVTPYTTYNIEAGIVPGKMALTPSRNYFISPIDASGIFILLASNATIPSYSREFRVSTNALGYVRLNNISGSPSEFYDHQAAQEWCVFSPDMYSYSIYIYGIPNIGTDYSYSIEFR